MDRRDLALAITSDSAARNDEEHPLDRVRMQKAVFLLVMRGEDAWRQLYKYRPYDWGPYSGELSADLEAMGNSGLVQVEKILGKRHGRYRTTVKGEAEAERIWTGLDEAERAFVQRVRAYVTSKSFAELLREIYAAYPEYATASKFSG